MNLWCATCWMQIRCLSTEKLNLVVDLKKNVFANCFGNFHFSQKVGRGPNAILSTKVIAQSTRTFQRLIFLCTLCKKTYVNQYLNVRNKLASTLTKKIKICRIHFSLNKNSNVSFSLFQTKKSFMNKWLKSRVTIINFTYLLEFLRRNGFVLMF